MIQTLLRNHSPSHSCLPTGSVLWAFGAFESLPGRRINAMDTDHVKWCESRTDTAANGAKNCPDESGVHRLHSSSYGWGVTAAGWTGTLGGSWRPPAGHS